MKQELRLYSEVVVQEILKVHMLKVVACLMQYDINAVCCCGTFTKFGVNECDLLSISLSFYLSPEGQQQLHLFLSSHSSKSLEDARRLSENLLDTISVECGVSR